MEFLIVAAVGLLVAVAVADFLRSKEASSRPQVATIPDPGALSLVPPRRTRRQQIQWIGDHWVRNFAAGVRGCEYMSQPLCERLACEHVGYPRRKIPKCRVPTRAQRKAFEGALVFDVAFKGNRAAARLSNGKVIELWGDQGTWWVNRIGPNAGRGFFASREAPGGNRFSSPTDNRE